jgi:hypothetical protein
MNGVTFAWCGADGDAHCCVYPDRVPILSGWSGGVSVTLTPAGKTTVTAAELRFARQLLAALSTYVQECARWTGGTADRLGEEVSQTAA